MSRLSRCDTARFGAVYRVAIRRRVHLTGRRVWAVPIAALREPYAQHRPRLKTLMLGAGVYQANIAKTMRAPSALGATHAWRPLYTKARRGRNAHHVGMFGVV